MPPTSMQRPGRSAQRRRSRLVVAVGAGWLGLAVHAAAPTGDERAGADLKRAEERAQICSADNAIGSGLRGEYFAKASDRRAALVRVDKTVDFDTGLEWPGKLAGQFPTSARWTGWVRPPYSGNYRFHVEQDGARVVVARRTVVDNGISNSEGVRLEAGRFYPIEVDAGNLAAVKGRLMLEWTAPHGARYVVPRALLFVPTTDPAT